MLLREPDFQPKDENDRLRDFWFQNVVKGTEKSGTGTRYLNFYKTFVGKLFGISEETRLIRMENCAYMNLRPDAGDKQRSPEYYKILEELRKLDKENFQAVV